MSTRRFSDRELQWMDVIGRFEGHSHSHHHHDARGAIGALEDEGAKFWDRGSPEFQKWRRCCTDLQTLLNGLGRRRHLEHQPLETAMREFIQAFEHSKWRMHQLMYSTDADSERSERIRGVSDWLDLVFLTSTYALVSAWIDDKQQTSTLRTEVNLITGEVSHEHTLKQMKVPKKYQKSTKRF